MATTANNGWDVPVSTDLVRNGATAIKTLGDSIDASVGKLTYTSFTPSITGTGSGWALGTGSSSTGSYCQIGKTVFLDAQITLGTSPSAGSNAFAIALPVNSSSAISEWVSVGSYFDNDQNDLYPCVIKISSDKVEFYIQNTVTGSNPKPIVAKAFNDTNKPVVPASGDVFTCSITYRAA